MRKYRWLVALLILTGCPGGNITEVGNPKTDPTKIEVVSGIVSAIQANLAAALSSLEGRGEDESSDGYTCHFEKSSNSILCECPLGGSITKQFQGEIGGGGEGIVFGHSVLENYQDCAVTSCGVTLTLSGEIESTYSGTFNREIGSDDLEIHQKTADLMTGMRSGDVEFSFDVKLSFVGLTQDLSGTLCVAGECLTFTSLTDLQTQVDPGNTCPDGFQEESFPRDGDQGAEEECTLSPEACLDQCRADGRCL